MTITTNHTASSYGLPVILDDVGKVMDYADGIREARKRLGWTQAEAAEAAGKSVRSVKLYEAGGQAPPAEYLNVLFDSLQPIGKPSKPKPKAGEFWTVPKQRQIVELLSFRDAVWACWIVECNGHRGEHAMWEHERISTRVIGYQEYELGGLVDFPAETVDW